MSRYEAVKRWREKHYEKHLEINRLSAERMRRRRGIKPRAVRVNPDKTKKPPLTAAEKGKRWRNRNPEKVAAYKAQYLIRKKAKREEAKKANLAKLELIAMIAKQAKAKGHNVKMK